MIKLIIYDLDGTLIDSRLDIANAVNWTLNQLGCASLSVGQISQYVGKGVGYLIRNSLSEIEKKEIEPEDDRLERAIGLFRERYSSHLLENTVLFPGSQQVLRHFSKCHQAVITNKPSDFSKRILDELGIAAYFFKIVGGDDHFPKKPAPDSIYFLMEAANAMAEETVLVGDSDIDVAAGKNAGIHTVAVTFGFQSRAQIERSTPEFIIAQLSDLMDCSLFKGSN